MSGHIGDMVSQHWNTPEGIIIRVRECFGGQIDLDPCDNEHSITNARVSYKLPGANGLERSWLAAPDGTDIRNVFCNPPYGRDPERKTSIADWVERAYGYGCGEPGPEVILLIPSSTETNFWHSYIWPYADGICFVKNRIVFPLEGKEKASATKGSAIIYYGPSRKSFVDAFGTLGYIPGV